MKPEQVVSVAQHQAVSGKIQQDLGVKTKSELTSVRPREGQSQELTGVETERRQSWESNSEPTGAHTRIDTNPGEASGRLGNNSSS